MNGQNIQLFQFDYDLTWMAFFMDADGRTYARYGGREDSGPDDLLSRDSLIHTMKRVLELHRERSVQTRHEPGPNPLRRPEDIPAMSNQMQGRREKCIHCHDVKAAEFREAQKAGSFSSELVFGYPPPSSIGLKLSNRRQEVIEEVQPDSPSARAKLRAGDELISIDGYRILTAADLARVLHVAPRQAELPVQVRRGDQIVQLSLKVMGDWKRTADPSWRASIHWAGPNGGFWGVPLYRDEKARLNIPADALAIRISFFFKNQPAPLKAGLKINDILVEFDGRRDDLTAKQLHAHLQINRRYGDHVPLVVLRDGKEVKLTLELPERPNWE